MLMHSADVMMLGNSLSCLYNHLTALSDTLARQLCLFTLLLRPRSFSTRARICVCARVHVWETESAIVHISLKWGNIFVERTMQSSLLAWDESDPFHPTHPDFPTCIRYILAYLYFCVPCIHPAAIPQLMRSHNLHPHLPPSLISIPPQSPAQPTLMKLIESEIDNA